MPAIEIEARQTTMGAGVFRTTNYMQPFEMLAATDGRGLWSYHPTKVRVIGLALGYVDEDEGFGELRAFFDTETWDTMQHGLIYTDPLWIKEFHSVLVAFGLSGKVDYSEQGMQGDNYVSMDADGEFIRSWRQIFG